MFYLGKQNSGIRGPERVISYQGLKVIRVYRLLGLLGLLPEAWERSPGK